jgi:transketolase
LERSIRARELTAFAEEIRVETLRTLGYAGFGHIGGAMSIVEVVAALYGEFMRIDPTRPDWPDRDKLVLSKGHAGPTLYAVLALKGYFPRMMLRELNVGGGHLPSHVDRNKTPGIDMTAGSLGQGISAAIGIAMGDKMSGRDSRTYLIVGDGELDEGQNWEGFMFAAAHKVDNLVCFIDKNGQQLDGYTKDVLDSGDIAAKLKAFGWNTQEIDGHDMGAIMKAVKSAISTKGVPSAIVLDTKKGHGCTFAEGVLANHHMNFTPEQMEEAMKAANERLEAARRALAD